MPYPFLSLVHDAGTEQGLTWLWLGTADILELKVGCGLANRRAKGILGGTVTQKRSDGGGRVGCGSLRVRVGKVRDGDSSVGASHI